MIHPVVLSGGSGTRLWPMSRTLYPKQLLTLLGRDSLLQQTVRRVVDDVRFAAPVLVANEEHRFIIAEQLREIALVPRGLLLEPIGRNTAPAASSGALVSFGISPERAETGYGYIRRGGALETKGAFTIAEFVEKPGPEQAKQYLASGEYLWNSGIFMFPVRLYIDELERLRPAMVAACRRALTEGRQESDFIRLDKDAFSTCDSDSIDYAVMEKTRRAAVVPAAMGWSDIGSWDALWEMSGKDHKGNSIEGNVIAEDTRNCYLRSEAGLVAAIGIEDLVVVGTADAVMVAPRKRTQEVKTLVARLVKERRDEAEALPTVHRPWGSFTSLHNGHRVQVKHIVVKPGGKLSLQLHHHRAEHWVVVQGTAKIRRGDEEMMLSEDQSTYIPIGTAHRLENPGKIPLHLIEVQSGSYLGEDDIVRLEDSYGRT